MSRGHMVPQRSFVIDFIDSRENLIKAANSRVCPTFLPRTTSNRSSHPMRSFAVQQATKQRHNLRRKHRFRDYDRHSLLTRLDVQARQMIRPENFVNFRASARYHFEEILLRQSHVGKKISYLVGTKPFLGFTDMTNRNPWTPMFTRATSARPGCPDFPTKRRHDDKSADRQRLSAEAAWTCSRAAAPYQVMTSHVTEHKISRSLLWINVRLRRYFLKKFQVDPPRFSTYSHVAASWIIFRRWVPLCCENH
jgi:hypothetical protein